MMNTAASSRPSVSALTDAQNAVWVSIAWLASGRNGVPFVILDRADELGIVPADGVVPMMRDGLAVVWGSTGVAREFDLDSEVRVLFA